MSTPQVVTERTTSARLRASISNTNDSLEQIRSKFRALRQVLEVAKKASDNKTEQRAFSKLKAIIKKQQKYYKISRRRLNKISKLSSKMLRNKQDTLNTDHKESLVDLQTYCTIFSKDMDTASFSLESIQESFDNPLISPDLSDTYATLRSTYKKFEENQQKFQQHIAKIETFLLHELFLQTTHQEDKVKKDQSQPPERKSEQLKQTLGVMFRVLKTDTVASNAEKTAPVSTANQNELAHQEIKNSLRMDIKAKHDDLEKLNQQRTSISNIGAKETKIHDTALEQSIFATPSKKPSPEENVEGNDTIMISTLENLTTRIEEQERSWSIKYNDLKKQNERLGSLVKSKPHVETAKVVQLESELKNIKAVHSENLERVNAAWKETIQTLESEMSNNMMNWENERQQLIKENASLKGTVETTKSPAIIINLDVNPIEHLQETQRLKEHTQQLEKCVSQYETLKDDTAKVVNNLQNESNSLRSSTIISKSEDELQPTEQVERSIQTIETGKLFSGIKTTSNNRGISHRENMKEIKFQLENYSESQKEVSKQVQNVVNISERTWERKNYVLRKDIEHLKFDMQNVQHNNKDLQKIIENYKSKEIRLKKNIKILIQDTRSLETTILEQKRAFQSETETIISEYEARLQKAANYQDDTERNASVFNQQFLQAKSNFKTNIDDIRQQISNIRSNMTASSLSTSEDENIKNYFSAWQNRNINLRKDELMKLNSEWTLSADSYKNSFENSLEALKQNFDKIDTKKLQELALNFARIKKENNLLKPEPRIFQERATQFEESPISHQQSSIEQEQLLIKHDKEYQHIISNLISEKESAIASEKSVSEKLQNMLTTENEYKDAIKILQKEKDETIEAYSKQLESTNLKLDVLNLAHKRLLTEYVDIKQKLETKAHFQPQVAEKSSQHNLRKDLIISIPIVTQYLSDTLPREMSSNNISNERKHVDLNKEVATVEKDELPIAANEKVAQMKNIATLVAAESRATIRVLQQRVHELQQQLNSNQYTWVSQLQKRSPNTMETGSRNDNTDDFKKLKQKLSDTNRTWNQKQKQWAEAEQEYLGSINQLNGKLQRMEQEVGQGNIDAKEIHDKMKAKVNEISLLKSQLCRYKKWSEVESEISRKNTDVKKILNTFDQSSRDDMLNIEDTQILSDLQRSRADLSNNMSKLNKLYNRKIVSLSQQINQLLRSKKDLEKGSKISKPHQPNTTLNASLARGDKYRNPSTNDYLDSIWEPRSG